MGRIPQRRQVRLQGSEGTDAVLSSRLLRSRNLKPFPGTPQNQLVAKLDAGKGKGNKK